MRPHDNHEDRGAGPRGRPRARLGVAPRCAGEAAARGRAAAFRGFTPALPHAGAARRALEEGGRQLGLRPGPVRTLSALLGLYRGWGLRRPPVLAATNARIARAAGCDERTVQKHRALLLARAALAAEAEPDGPVMERLDAHRRALRRARRRLNHPAAAPAELAALRQGLGPLRAALEALAAASGPAAVDDGVEDAVDRATDPSPRGGAPGVHRTES